MYFTSPVIPLPVQESGVAYTLFSPFLDGFDGAPPSNSQSFRVSHEDRSL